MKKKLLVIGLFLLIWTAGCTPEYNLTVTSDKKFVEKINFVIDRNVFSENNQLAKKTIESNIDGYKTVPEFNDYYFNYKITKDKVYIMIKAEHFDFERFKMSPMYKLVFERVVELEGESYLFITSGEFYNINAGDSADPNLYIDDFDINIRFHNKVIKTNADFEDFNTNTFTWNIKGTDFDRKIEVELDYSKRYDIILIDFLLNNIVAVMSITLLGGTSIIIGMYLVSQNRLKNKI